jgi:hypothetical protein
MCWMIGCISCSLTTRLEETAVDDEVDKGGKHQDDEPGGPGMKLAPVAVMVEGQDGQDEKVEGGHRRTTISFVGRMKYANAAMRVVERARRSLRQGGYRAT